MLCTSLFFHCRLGDREGSIVKYISNTMKGFFSLSLLVLFQLDAFAAGGFTYLSSVSHSLNLPEHSVTFFVILSTIFLIGLAYRFKTASVSNVVIPDPRFGLRSVSETVGQFVYNQCKTIIGEEEGTKYFPYIYTIFVTILLSNLIGLFPGFLPPTQNLNTTLALGLFTFLYYNYQGMKAQGVVNYLKHFAGPLWYMAFLIFPIEIISNFVRPLSLSLRLRGNIFGDHLVMGIFSDLVPLIVPIPFLILGLLVSIIQAYVFTVLTMVYIALAVAHQEDH